MKRSLFTVINILIGSIMVASCGDNKPAAPNPASMPVPVNLYDVQYQKAKYYDRFPGTVVAMQQVDLHPVVEGYITAVYFKEGDHIKKGQRLYAVDSRKYQASANQAQANVKVAESNLAQAQKDADRYIYLNQHDAVAKQLLDHALTTLQVAKNQLTAAKQDLAKTQTDLGYSIIKAPFDGTIGISQVKIGNAVTGQTLLNTISTEDPMAVDIVINEKQITRFAALEHKTLSPADSLFTLLMPDNSLYNYSGHIYLMDRGVNPQTGTITVRLVFPNPIRTLRPGMSCIIRVRNTESSEQLVIPSKAIVEQMGEYFVFVAKDTLAPAEPGGKDLKQQGPAPRALQRKVILGATIKDSVIVNAGIQSGDKIIVDGVQKLHDGSLIATGAPGAPGKGAGH